MYSQLGGLKFNPENVIPTIIGLIFGPFIVHDANIIPIFGQVRRLQVDYVEIVFNDQYKYHPKRYEQKVLCYSQFAVFLYSTARFKAKRYKIQEPLELGLCSTYGKTRERFATCLGYHISVEVILISSLEGHIINVMIIVLKVI